MKYIIWILVGAVIILVISQWKSCGLMADNDKVIDTLQTEKKVIQRQLDSVNHDQAGLKTSDSILRITTKRDSLKLRHENDSLKSLYRLAQGKLQDIKGQMKQTLAALINSVDSGANPAALAELEKFKDQLSQANYVVDYLQANSSQRDSLANAQFDSLYNTIQLKNLTIDSLISISSFKDTLIARANTDLDKAIAQLKKGKKTNILRTIGEVALVIALILK